MGLTQLQKDKSRQIQLYAMLALMYVIVVGTMWLAYLGKDLSGIGAILGTGFASLAAGVGLNYFSKPKGEDAE